jgi:hypothetical protein
MDELLEFREYIINCVGKQIVRFFYLIKFSLG